MANDNSKDNPKEQIIELTKQTTGETTNETNSNDTIIKQIENTLETFNSNSNKQDTSLLDLFNTFNEYIIKNNEILTELNTNLSTISNQFIAENRDFTSKVQENQNANFIWYLGKSASLLEQLNEKLEKENFNNNLCDALEKYEKNKEENKDKINTIKELLGIEDTNEDIDIPNENLEDMPPLKGAIYDSKVIDSKLYETTQQETLARLETGIDLEKTDENFRETTENQKELEKKSSSLKSNLDENISKANENRDVTETIQQAIDEFNEIPKLIDTLNKETKTLRAKKSEDGKELVIQRAKEYDTLVEKLKELSSSDSDDKFVNAFGNDGEYARTYIVDSIKESLQLYNTELLENTTKLLNSDVKSTKKGLKSLFKRASDDNNKIDNFTFEEDDSIKNINAEFDLTKKNIDNKDDKKDENKVDDKENDKEFGNNKQLEEIGKLLKELINELKNKNKNKETKNTEEKSKDIEEKENYLPTIVKTLEDISNPLKLIFDVFNSDE